MWPPPVVHPTPEGCQSHGKKHPSCSPVEVHPVPVVLPGCLLTGASAVAKRASYTLGTPRYIQPDRVPRLPADTHIRNSSQHAFIVQTAAAKAASTAHNPGQTDRQSLVRCFLCLAVEQARERPTNEPKPAYIPTIYLPREGASRWAPTAASQSLLPEPRLKLVIIALDLAFSARLDDNTRPALPLAGSPSSERPPPSGASLDVLVPTCALPTSAGRSSHHVCTAHRRLD